MACFLISHLSLVLEISRSTSIGFGNLVKEDCEYRGL